MKIKDLVRFASDKSNFQRLDDYTEFSVKFLEFIERGGLQARIVSQNEPKYHFLQFGADADHNISRPINSELFMSKSDATSLLSQLRRLLRSDLVDQPHDLSTRRFVQRAIYTLQQCIGAALDALPSGKSNTARKINGDLFEQLIRTLMQEAGVECTSGTVSVPVPVPGGETFKMNFQHDLLVKMDEELKIIGSVKTSSKDRIGKIFIDKMLYSRLTETDIPHVAVFLNDVQRKNTRHENRYGVSATFLPGHFKGYTLKLNPLDGVYYCDIRPNMESDPVLSEHIRTIDVFFLDDLWDFLRRPGDRFAQIGTAASVSNGDDD